MQSKVAQNLPRDFGYKILGRYIGVNLNSANTDFPVTLNDSYTNYVVRRISFNNSSISNPSSCTVGVFTGAGGTGNTLVSNASVTLTTAGVTYFDATLAASATSSVQTSPVIYVRVGTAQGAAATADVYIYGDPISF